MASYVLFKSDSILLNIVQYFCDDKMLEAEWYFTLRMVFYSERNIHSQTK